MMDRLNLISRSTPQHCVSVHLLFCQQEELICNLTYVSKLDAVLLGMLTGHYIPHDK
jgi:hypothetical protein